MAELHNKNLSDSSNNAIHIAEAYAKESFGNFIEPAHLLKALLHKDTGLVDFIEKDLDKDYYYLLDWADTRIKLLPKSSKKNNSLSLSNEVNNVLKEAENYSIEYGIPEIEPVYLLAAAVTPGVGFTFEQLKSLPLSPNEILSKVKSTPVKPLESQKQISGNQPLKNLSKYTINKNTELQSGRSSVIIGFEKELQTIFDTLGRKSKSSILLIGESGIGKTALINAFVQRINKDEVPDCLKEATVYELDISLVSSEANYKGEIEDRVKKVLSEISGINNSILVIEGIDKVFEKHSILYGISTLLKRELNNNTLKLIATSSVEGFTKNLEIDKEFTGKVEKLTIEEPDFEMSVRIIKGIKDNFETHYNLKISEETVKESIRLAKRYMGDRSLPDSALDLIDRASSHIHTMNNISEREIILLINRLNSIKESSAEKDIYEIDFELKWLYHEILNRLSTILTSQADEKIDISSLENNEKKIEYLNSLLTELQKYSENKRESIDVPDLSLIIAQQTGIPIGKVQTKEKEKLLNAESILKERVVGQDHAIKTVLEAIYESRSGLNKKGQPIASVFFLGPTGTGKTELTKALAEFLFQDESSIIRFDMSEFMESHSVATMTGAPAGYVGYEEGGLLVNKIRQKPYSIVLFDEIEKAHPDVFNIFLQIMDEGRIHDKLNRTGDFSNALVVFTSNVGSDYVFKSFKEGNIPSSNDLKQIMIERKFKPEFLGRITEIIPFSPITKEIVLMIFDIHLKNLYKTLKDMDINLKISDKAKEHLALSEFSPELGARPIIGVIRNEIRRPLSKMIISGEVKPGSSVILDVKKGKLEWKY
ncbi:MAG: ATP-dependent Clp protease ATP-binding subunit [Bacteroidales bacterium]|jgi:ATP-dependent Clp protease ATP-binding subunit ClpA|nr:ATP-dependent Clp protease ATP-binding subunit [Bacteroidales bacterium]